MKANSQEQQSNHPQKDQAKGQLTEQPKGASKNFQELIKWLIAILLLCGAVAGTFIYEDSAVIKTALAVLLIAAALGVAAITVKGQEAIHFAKSARMEMRKVVWPTRQETVQTGLIVIAALAVMSLILWGVDGLFIRAISFITNA